MTVVKHTEPPYIYTGLSSDSKPAATPTSIFIELDTGDKYLMLSSWTKFQDTLSQYSTLTTLIAGENSSAFAGAWIQVSGGGPVYKEQDWSAGYDFWTTDKALMLGVKYWGTAGILYFTDYGDNSTQMTFFDTATYGIQEEAIQGKSISATSTIEMDKLGIFKTKTVTS